jgi:hypothetical protein
MKLWFAIFKDAEGHWRHITGDHGEIYMWPSKEEAKEGLKRHPDRFKVHYCKVEEQEEAHVR